MSIHFHTKGHFPSYLNQIQRPWVTREEFCVSQTQSERCQSNCLVDYQVVKIFTWHSVIVNQPTWKRLPSRVVLWCWYFQGKHWSRWNRWWKSCLIAFLRQEKCQHPLLIQARYWVIHGRPNTWMLVCCHDAKAIFQSSRNDDCTFHRSSIPNDRNQWPWWEYWFWHHVSTRTPFACCRNITHFLITVHPDFFTSGVIYWCAFGVIPPRDYYKALVHHPLIAIPQANHLRTMIKGLSSFIDDNTSNPPSFHSPASLVKIDDTLTLPCTISQSQLRNLSAFFKKIRRLVFSSWSK